MKRLLSLLFFISLSFAAGEWIASTLFAVITSIIILAILFMFGHGFENQELKITAKEELYQIIVVVIIIASLAGVTGVLDTISSGISGQDLSFPQLALNYVQQDAQAINGAYEELASFSHDVGREGSRSLSCIFMSVSVGTSSCGAYNSLVASMSIIFQGLGIAIAELGSLLFLLQFASSYAFGLLLPFGLFLRVFKLTRGAGAIVIALAVALYIFLPISIFIFHNILGEFESSNPRFSGNHNLPDVEDDFECDPYDVSSLDNFRKAENLMFSSVPSFEYYAYLIVIKATLSIVISLIIMVAGLRYISSLAGADVDVSMLGRIA